MKITLLLMAALSAFAPIPLPAQQHSHYAAGIVDANGNGQPDAGEPLQFVGPNGTAKTFHLLARPVGYWPAQRCGGYYVLDERPRTLFPGDGFSLIALSDGQIEAAAPGHAHTGAWIWAEILAVSGPDGASFGFWDEDRSKDYQTPSVSFAVNQPFAPYRFVLSEGGDNASEDPQGHIHARSWTADSPGHYYVSFRLVDRSTSGPGGGPWHPPSQIYIYHFLAGPSFQPTPQFIAGTGLKLTWPSQLGILSGVDAGIAFTIERATSLHPANWESIGTVVGTTADTATFTDPAPPEDRAFYRLKYLWSNNTLP